MDDYGNCYMTEDWFTNAEAYSASMATFGFFDDCAANICFEHGLDYAAQDV